MVFDASTSLSLYCGLLACGAVIYGSFLAAYRLFLHPLCRFPGSPLASLSEWHWAYCANDPGYLIEAHQKYGPVVRIRPNALHFSDYTAHQDIHDSASRFPKDPEYYKCFTGEESSFGYTDPKLAKARRDILSSLFSRRAIIKLESVIQGKVDTLVSRMVAQGHTPVDLQRAYRSTALDIITSYCFAESCGALQYPLLQHPLLLGLETALTLVWVLFAFPIVHLMIPVLPVLGPIIQLISPSMAIMLDFRTRLEAQINRLLKNPDLLDGTVAHETVYHHLMTPQSAKDEFHMPSMKSLLDESITMVSAGSDTVGNTATVGTFHILNNEKILEALVRELEQAWPDVSINMNYERLEKLPYLTAVIKESLRMSYGIVSPMPRIVGPSAAIIAGTHVPAGTSVSICAPFVHNNSTLFPEPFVFKPDRWLQPNSHELNNYQIAFSKGPRSCIGVNLAWCELYLIFGNMFRKLDMQLYNTSVEDFTYKSYLLPAYTGRHLHVNIEERRS